MYMASLDGRLTPTYRDGRSVTAHAPGFSDAGGNMSTMHQSLDAVVMRALAAAWQVYRSAREQGVGTVVTL